MEYYRLSDCADYRNERTSKIDFETYITTDNMLPDRAGITKTETLPDTKSVSKYLPNDVLLSNIRPYFKKIWFANREGGCSNDVLVVTAKQNTIPEFLYYVLSDDNFFTYDNITSKGTKMPRGDKQQIMNYPVVIPSKESLESFNEIVAPMLDLIASNRAENIRLTSLRDSLLPKLMSGELDISELDI